MSDTKSSHAWAIWDRAIFTPTEFRLGTHVTVSVSVSVTVSVSVSVVVVISVMVDAGAVLVIVVVSVTVTGYPEGGHVGQSGHSTGYPVVGRGQ